MSSEPSAPAPPREQITAFLVAAREGDESAQSRLFVAVHEGLIGEPAADVAP